MGQLGDFSVGLNPSLCATTAALLLVLPGIPVVCPLLYCGTTTLDSSFISFSLAHSLPLSLSMLQMVNVGDEVWN